MKFLHNFSRTKNKLSFPRNGLIKPVSLKNSIRKKLSKKFFSKISTKIKSNPKCFEIEKNKIKYILGLVKRLDSSIRQQNVKIMLKLIELLVNILNKNDYYYLTKKGMLIIIKISYVLEDTTLCISVLKELLKFAFSKKDTNCLLFCWLKYSECLAKQSLFNQSLSSYFQFLKYALISNNKNMELKAYDKIGMIFFNLDQINEAKYFHSKGLNREFQNTTDIKNMETVREILKEIYHLGYPKDYKLVVHKFLYKHDMQSVIDELKDIGSLNLSSIQEMELILYLMNINKNTISNNEFKFSKISPIKIDPESNEYLFFNKMYEITEEISVNSKSIENLSKSFQIECKCHSLQYYETICKFCKELKSKSSNSVRNNIPKNNVIISKNSKSSKKYKKFNKYGESLFNQKENKIQKNKLLKNLKNVLKNQMLKTHLSNNRNLNKIKNQAYNNNKLKEAIVKSNMKQNRIWGISKSLIEFCCELEFIYYFIDNFNPNKNNN